MSTRKSQAAIPAPSLAPDRAYSAIKKQLDALQLFRAQSYQEAHAQEQEWSQFTQSIVELTFGSPSSNLTKFYRAKSAGEYYMSPYGGGTDHHQNQSNFEARAQAYTSFLKSCLAELELRLPETEIKGQYAPGEEYEFYKDTKFVLSTAKSDVLIVDPYLDTQVFDVYAGGIDRSVNFRLLTNNLPGSVSLLAQKYSTGGNLALRTTNAIHDRVIFADQRVWMIGQSLKDAAKKKPTYIVEHDATLAKPLYEDIWAKATVVI